MKLFLSYHRRPTSDEVLYTNKPTVYNVRKPAILNPVKPVDMDKDEGGIYKARKNMNDYNANEVPESENMIVDLPIEQQIAYEVDVRSLF
jgi:hypothetical protein